MKLFLSALFDAWNAADIRYLILRNYYELPEYTENDVDVLLDPSQRSQARAIMRCTAEGYGWEIHNIGEFSCHAFYLYHLETLEQIHIDLMCGVKWHSFFFASHADMLRARRPLKNFYTPDPVHEAAVNLLTRLLYSGYVKEKYRDGIQQRAERAGDQFKATLAPWTGQRLARKIVKAAGQGEWGVIESQASGVRKHTGFANLKKPFRLAALLMADVARWVRRWISPPGISIVFMGPDGCGKTSVADQLKQELQGTFAPEHGIHCHWKPVRQMSGNAPTENPHGLAPRSRLLSLLYFGYHYLPFLWGWWRYIKPVLFRNGLAVIDRYYYDFFVDQRRYRLNLPEWIIKVGFVFIKNPNLVFCLDADPGILQARKQEVSFEECKRQRETYRALASRLSTGHVIDASQELDAVVRDVQKIILVYMNERANRRFVKL